MIENKRKHMKAQVSERQCVACGCCVKACPLGLISIVCGQFARIDAERCVGCGKCVKECPATVIELREAAE